MGTGDCRQGQVKLHADKLSRKAKQAQSHAALRTRGAVSIGDAAMQGSGLRLLDVKGNYRNHSGQVYGVGGRIWAR
jgi:hypothetical protein